MNEDFDEQEWYLELMRAVAELTTESGYTIGDGDEDCLCQLLPKPWILTHCIDLLVEAIESHPKMAGRFNPGELLDGRPLFDADGNIIET